jgi:hypothetical protein
MSNSNDAVRKILDLVKADKRTSLTAEGGWCVILMASRLGVASPLPRREARDRHWLSGDEDCRRISFTKTEAGGVMVG